MFEFAYPWVLALLIPYFAAVLYDCYWKKAPTVTVASAAPFAAAVRRRIPWAKLFLALGGCVLILALARPRFGDERIAIRSQGIDMILAIDLSGSMGAIDVPEGITDVRTLEEKRKSGAVTNRLEDAKRELTKFVAQRPNDRIGLIGFAPQSYYMVPPTLDHGWLTARLKGLEPGIIGDMTGIASPLA
ncbi:MAG: VWA domain-containing protein, partial [Lentisphaeria bacterium]|nr:VWA domain-containing protein [Lentisphaeria bacterium]